MMKLTFILVIRKTLQNLLQELHCWGIFIWKIKLIVHLIISFFFNRIAYLKTNYYLHNITISLKSSILEDVYYIDDNSLKLSTSAYLELPQGM